MKSRHTLKFGASWNYYRMNRYYAGNNGQLGLFEYTARFTGATVGDFLLDQLSRKGRGSLSEPWTHLQHRTAFYGGDDYKITDSLTLNLALRWGYTSPLVEQDDRQANVSLVNAEQQFAGENGNSRALYEPYYNGWEPRLGFAYRSGDKWVFRGGYGITQYMEGTGANLRLPLNPPFFFESEVSYDRDQRCWNARDRLRRPAGAGSAVGAASGVGSEPSAAVHAAVERVCRVPARVAVVDQLSATWAARPSTCVTPIEGNQPLPGVGDPSTWAPLQNRRPLFAFNPLITNISTTMSRGRSNYNALQTTFKQRLWNGLDFFANYTYGKALSNNLGYYGSGGVAAEGAYPMNSYNIELNYGPAFFDAKHIFSLAGSYELPFGKDRQYGNDWNRAH